MNRRQFIKSTVKNFSMSLFSFLIFFGDRKINKVEASIPPCDLNPCFNLCYSVDCDVCTNCEKCMDVCPFDAIFSYAQDECVIIDQDECYGCGACYEVCPSGAIVEEEC